MSAVLPVVHPFPATSRPPAVHLAPVDRCVHRSMVRYPSSLARRSVQIGIPWRERVLWAVAEGAGIRYRAQLGVGRDHAGIPRIVDFEIASSHVDHLWNGTLLCPRVSTSGISYTDSESMRNKMSARLLVQQSRIHNLLGQSLRAVSHFNYLTYIRLCTAASSHRPQHPASPYKTKSIPHSSTHP